MLRARVQLLPALIVALAALLPAEDPKPEAILDKFVEVTGGREAYDKIRTQIATGSVELTSMGMNGALTAYKSAPDKSYTVIDFSGFGKAEEGTNGHVAWSLNGMEGARVKEGDERAAALRNGATHLETRWRDFYKNVELSGSEDVGGKPCYKLVLTPNEGSPETRYYEKNSNLLVRVVMPVTTPNGAVTLDMSLGDYRDEGGLLTPHSITQKLPNTEVVVKIESVRHNEEIPDSRFDLPDEVKAVMAEKK
jgi:hypothetical protein